MLRLTGPFSLAAYHRHVSVVLVTARRFVALLDNSDWDAMTALLAADCQYECRGTTSVGAAAIVASYQQMDAWVRATFEDVRYQSAVAPEPGEPMQARLQMRDHMRHGEHTLDFQCEQRITVSDAGRIVAIEHFDLEGEREKADAFNRACGVARPD